MQKDCKQCKISLIWNVLVFVLDFLHLINQLGAPWGGSCPERKRITNTCPLDGILSLITVQYHQSKSFRETVQRFGLAGDNISQTLCDMMCLITGSGESWTQGRLLWLERIVGQTPVSDGSNLFGL